MLRKIINFINANLWLRQQLVALAKRIRAYDRIKSFYYYLNRVSEGDHLFVGRRKRKLYQSSQLTPRARQIYHDLKTAIENNKEQQ